MFILLDTRVNSFYVTVNRNGSTLLSEIHERHRRSTRRIQADILIKHLEATPETSIYVPYRDPLVRFKSGLVVNLYNKTVFNQDFPDQEMIEKSLRHFKTILDYFDKTFGNMENVIGQCFHRPYHLFDQHTDHWLGLPLILCVYGYNVNPIKMSDFSALLRANFTNIDDLISKRERSNSYDTSKPQDEKIFQIYKEIFNNEPSYQDRIGLHLRKTFDQWMAPELEIFRYLQTYAGTPNQNFAAHRLANKFFNDKTYFNDPYSVNHSAMLSLVKEIHKHRSVNSRFKFLIDNYKMISSGLDQTLNFTYRENDENQ